MLPAGLHSLRSRAKSAQDMQSKGNFKLINLFRKDFKRNEKI